MGCGAILRWQGIDLMLDHVCRRIDNSGWGPGHELEQSQQRQGTFLSCLMHTKELMESKWTCASENLTADLLILSSQRRDKIEWRSFEQEEIPLRRFRDAGSPLQRPL